MVRRKPEDALEPLPPPAKTLEGREEQLIVVAMDLVERRMREGTASAQETVHFLRQATVSNQLAMEKLQNENEVLKARVREMETRGHSSASAEEALRAFRGYAGEDEEDDEDYDPNVY